MEKDSRLPPETAITDKRLGLTPRVAEILEGDWKEKVATLGVLLKKTRTDLLGIPGIAPVDVEGIADCLEAQGYELGELQEKRPKSLE